MYLCICGISAKGAWCERLFAVYHIDVNRQMALTGGVDQWVVGGVYVLGWQVVLQWVVVDCQTSDMANARAISASTIVLAEAQAQIPNGICNYVSQQMVL